MSKNIRFVSNKDINQFVFKIKNKKFKFASNEDADSFLF